MQSVNITDALPSWLDSETSALIEDIVDVLSERHPDLLAVILYGSVARHDERSLDDPDPSDVDLLAILDSDDPHVSIYQGGILTHSLSIAYCRHRDAPREVNVMFGSRSMQEWDPTFISNVKRDSMIIFTRGPLPAPFGA